MLKDIEINMPSYPVKEISSSYDNQTLARMVYVFVEGKWHKKAYFKHKNKPIIENYPSITNSDDALMISIENLLKEALEVKVSLGVVMDNLHKIQDFLALVVLVIRYSGEK
ncbi:hypothetical protein HAX54_041151, partial [Datura stramonium]|nr:hypothetical protein [Datura stramonium]